jgi:hypothetical protein
MPASPARPWQHPQEDGDHEIEETKVNEDRLLCLRRWQEETCDNGQHTRDEEEQRRPTRRYLRMARCR